MSWFDEAGNGQEVDVAALFDSEVPALLAAIVQAGAMVSMGTTRDGGTCCLTVTLDGRWKRQYFRQSEEAAPWLLEALEAVRSEQERRPASPAPRSRRQKA